MASAKKRLVARLGCLAVALLLAVAFVIIGILVFRHVRELARRDIPPLPSYRQKMHVADFLMTPPARYFVYPLGSRRGAFSYNAQPFTENNHLGDDWNGIGGEDTDLGDPVHVIANGRVIFADVVRGGWGGMVIVQHRLAEPYEGNTTIQSQYAHLEDIDVEVGELVHIGQVIGTVGNAGGLYWAHLHLELRLFDTPYVGAGYRENTRGWTDPTRLIQSRLLPPEMEYTVTLEAENIRGFAREAVLPGSGE